MRGQNLQTHLLGDHGLLLRKGLKRVGALLEVPVEKSEHLWGDRKKGAAAAEKSSACAAATRTPHMRASIAQNIAQAHLCTLPRPYSHRKECVAVPNLVPQIFGRFRNFFVAYR